jgi:isoleucyl-tRNA synthetase
MTAAAQKKGSIELKSVSEVEVTTTNAKGEKEVRAEVSRAEGKKCERCWNYDVTVGTHKEHEAICHRCVEAVKA